MDTPPDILYKYCDASGVDILRHLRVRITPPNQFNDPFEFAPRMKPSIPRRQARKAVREKKNIKSAYESMTSKGHFSGSFRAFRQRLKQQGAHGVMADKLIEEYPAHAANFRKEHVNIVSAEFGLLCLSSVHDDILMWSHYSVSHTGFVVGFRTGHPFFQGRTNLLQVEYNEERVMMGFTAGLPDGDRQASAKAIFQRKSPHWKYEKEWRQLHFLSSCVPEKDPAGKVVHYRPIDATLIAEVILGCRCLEAANEILTLLSNPAFAHVRVRHATIHDEKFKLDFSG